MTGRLVAGVAVVMVVGLATGGWAAESVFSGKIDVAKLTCKELMSGNDRDREVGMAYFHGFLAGKKNSQIVDVKTTSEYTDRVSDYCLSNPTSTVMNAFTKAGK